MNHIALFVLTVLSLCCSVSSAAELSWRQSSTALALVRDEKVIWQVVADPAEDKPYVHPLATVDGEPIAGFRPADHRWHRALWFSWKIINGVNYWEEDAKTMHSAGRSEIVKVEFDPRPNHEARIVITISYHPEGAAEVMRERRILEMGAPRPDGSYTIDWTADFTVGAAPVTLERTPPHEAKGRWSGGYAGLAVRFPPAFKGGNFMDHEASRSDDTAICGAGSCWVDYSSKLPSGNVAGVTICDHPSNKSHPVPFYANGQHPFINAALLWKAPLKLDAGAELHLRYRIVVHSGPADRATLDARWQEFSAK